MPDVEINDLASIGIIRDIPAHQLPPEAWSEGLNMRALNDGMERLDGREQVFGTPSVAPHYALPVQSPSQTFWLYVSLAKAYVYDGSTHTNITRQTLGVDVDYNAAQTRDWNGTLLASVPILNNGVDPPQYWSALSAATKLAVLPNWPASTSARIIRSFNSYLIALDMTKSGTRYPHMVKWSHPAEPGSVPISWDEADPTLDAGENDLPDVLAGIIQEALPLRGQFFIYKDGSTWRMTPGGALNIFNFDTFLETSGILGPRCVAITGDGTRHVVATQDDIIVHNGSSVESILSERWKEHLSNNIDPTNYRNSFMFTNAFHNEIVFCYPEVGSTNPTRALIWNYKLGQKGAITETEVNFRNVASGLIESASAAIWSTSTTAWDDYSDPWSQSIRRKLVGCATDATKFLQFDTGNLNNGAVFQGLLQRTGIAVVGKKRTGEWIVDWTKRKFLRRLWIKASGGPITVRVGTQNEPEGTVTWGASQQFDPRTQKWIDVLQSGLGLCVEFSSNNAFHLDGYKLEIELLGRY